MDRHSLRPILAGVLALACTPGRGAADEAAEESAEGSADETADETTGGPPMWHDGCEGEVNTDAWLLCDSSYTGPYDEKPPQNDWEAWACGEQICDPLRMRIGGTPPDHWFYEPVDHEAAQCILDALESNTRGGITIEVSANDGCCGGGSTYDLFLRGDGSAVSMRNDAAWDLSSSLDVSKSALLEVLAPPESCTTQGSDLEVVTCFFALGSLRPLSVLGGRIPGEPSCDPS